MNFPPKKYIYIFREILIVGVRLIWERTGQRPGALFAAQRDRRRRQRRAARRLRRRGRGRGRGGGRGGGRGDRAEGGAGTRRDQPSLSPGRSTASARAACPSGHHWSHSDSQSESYIPVAACPFGHHWSHPNSQSENSIALYANQKTVLHCAPIFSWKISKKVKMIRVRRRVLAAHAPVRVQ